MATLPFPGMDPYLEAPSIWNDLHKRPGEKRQEYLLKRNRYLTAGVHFIEIDLFRRWPRMPLQGDLPPCHYVVIVSDAQRRPVVKVWPLTLRQPLPTIPVPLLPPDAPVHLDIGAALRTAYGRARYDLRIHYDRPATPPLSPEDTVWAAELVASMSPN